MEKPIQKLILKPIPDKAFIGGRAVAWGNTWFSIVKYQTEPTCVIYLIKLHNGVWPPDQELIEECADLGYIKRKTFGHIDIIDTNKRRLVVYPD